MDIFTRHKSLYFIRHDWDDVKVNIMRHYLLQKFNNDYKLSSLLVDTGDVFDPQYEVLLRREKLIANSVPYFAISIKNLNEQKHLGVVSLLKQMNPKVYQQVSEVILNDSEELTLILKSKSKAISVLLGKEYWDDKISKLSKIQDHFSQKEKKPLVINLTSNKKVVVRF